MSGNENKLTQTVRVYRPDRVLWRWAAGADRMDGVKRNDGTWLRPATRDYSPDEFIWPPRTLRAEIRRDVSEIRREIRDRRAQRRPGPDLDK